MKVVVLGGAGDMGSRAVEDLALSPNVEKVTIADANAGAAAKLAASLRGRGAEVDVRPVDAGDRSALVEVMQGYNVAASALGPFYRFETELAGAAIEAGVDYTSICDDWSAALALLTEFDEPARGAGRVILTGLGASPGVTNVGIRYVAGQLDHVRRVDINVYQPLNAGGGEAVLKHMLYVISGEVASWRQSSQVMLPACSEAHMVEFPRYGQVKVWNMGHTEPVTLPRFITGLEECNFFMGFGRGASLFIRPAQRGLFASAKSRDRVARLLAPIERLTGGRQPAAGAIRVDVWGDKGGEKVHRMACGTGQMREVTGLALSVGTQMLGRREIETEKGGVYAPEACLDPEAFILAMKSKGVESFEDLAMTRPFL
jgi:lysine 6-dehydrogenase